MFQLVKVALLSFREFLKIDPSRHAAALSYYAFFSFPAIIVLISFILSALLPDSFFRVVQEEFVQQLVNYFGERSAILITTVTANLFESLPSIGTVLFSVVVLFFVSTNGFVQLRSSLNDIWKDVDSQNVVKRFVKGRLWSVVVMFAASFFVLLFILVTSFVSAAAQIVSALIAVPVFIITTLNYLIAFTLYTFIFALIYRYLPDIRLEWHDVMIGALLASVAFTIGQLILGFFLRRSGVDTVYGAASSLVILLIWMFVAAQILLYGAVFTKMYASMHGSHARRRARQHPGR